MIPDYRCSTMLASKLFYEEVACKKMAATILFCYERLLEAVTH